MTSRHEPTLDDFEIFEAGVKGRNILKKRFGERPVIAIRNTLAAFSVKAQSVLRIKSGDQVVFSKKKDEYYVAVLPITSRIKGYMLKSSTNVNGRAKIHLYCHAKRMVQSGFAIGFYEIAEPLHISGIDWYALDFIDE